MPDVQSFDLILSVPSVEEAIAWYERVLGWQGGMDVFGPDGKCDFGGVCLRQEPLTYIDLARSHAPQPTGDRACPFTLLVYVDDVDALYQHALECGVQPDSAPQNQFWGARTFTMRDLNGYRFNFAQKIENIQGEALQERYQQP